AARSAAAARAAAGMLLACRSCPSLAVAWATASELYDVAGDRAAADRLMGRALQLGPSDPTVLYAAARLRTARGDGPAAAELLRKCVAADHYRYHPLAVDVLLRAGRPELAMALSSGRPEHAAALYFAIGEPSTDAEAAARSAAVAAMRAACERGEVKPSVAAIAGREAAFAGDHAGAIRYLRQALAGNPSVVPWRVALALSMAATGEVDAARDELLVCLRLEPQNRWARSELNKLRDGRR
ncbi:MAG TPA: tetratricopeptide repeat protein, partial [Humisphaera sp.]